MSPKLLYIIILALLIAPRTSFACPRVSRLIDWNCDGKIKIAVTGDSFVKGVGDSVNGNKGGYVLRLAERLSKATVTNLGVIGATSGSLYSSFRTLLRKTIQGKTKRLTRDADIIIIDVGRNDYWSEVPAGLTVRNIVRLVKHLRRKVQEDTGVIPFVVIAYLAHTARLYQEPFIEEVNHAFTLVNQIRYPVKIHFDYLDTDQLSSDGLHPSSEGYDRLASILNYYVTIQLQREMRHTPRQKL